MPKSSSDSIDVLQWGPVVGLVSSGVTRPEIADEEESVDECWVSGGGNDVSEEELWRIEGGCLP